MCVRVCVVRACVCVCVCEFVKTECEIFLQSSMKHYIFLQEVLGLPHFESCQNCTNSANLVAEIH